MISSRLFIDRVEQLLDLRDVIAERFVADLEIGQAAGGLALFLKELIQRTDLFVLQGRLLAQRLQMRGDDVYGLAAGGSQVGGNLPLQEVELLADRLHAGMIGAVLLQGQLLFQLHAQRQILEGNRSLMLGGLVGVGIGKLRSRRGIDTRHGCVLFAGRTGRKTAQQQDDGLAIAFLDRRFNSIDLRLDLRLKHHQPRAVGFYFGHAGFVEVCPGLSFPKQRGILAKFLVDRPLILQLLQ